MEQKKLQELQNFIKSLGVEDDILVSKLMNVDPSKYEKELSYFRLIAGKCFKREYSHKYIEYVYIYPEISTYKMMGELHLHVNVDKYSFRHTGNSLTVFADKNYMLTTTSVDRFSKDFGWEEISKDHFDVETKKIEKMIEDTNNEYFD